MKRRRREQGGDDVETHNTTLEIVTTHAGRDGYEEEQKSLFFLSFYNTKYHPGF